LADKGTYFWTKIGDVPAAIQVKAAARAADREFGAWRHEKRTRWTCAWFAATIAIAAALEEGTFREDLSIVERWPSTFRRCAIHKEDIPALANYFLERYARRTAKPVTGITARCH